jgi:hypothetical protein
VEAVEPVDPLGTKKVGSDDPEGAGVSIDGLDPVAGDPELDEPPVPLGVDNWLLPGRTDDDDSLPFVDGSQSGSFDPRVGVSSREAGRGWANSRDSGISARGACGAGSVTDSRWIRDSSSGSQ